VSSDILNNESRLPENKVEEVSSLQEQKNSPRVFNVDLDELSEEVSEKPEEKPAEKEKKVNLEDLLEQEEGKKKNLLFLFDDFDEEA
jgi:hypothetical protein